MNGIAILGALPGSPAEESGLKYGDILLSVNGDAMSTVEDFLRARAAADLKMDLLIRRGAHLLAITLVLNKSRSGAGATALDAVEQLRQLHIATPPEGSHLN